MPEGYRGSTDKDRHQPLKSHFMRETEKPQQLLWLILVVSDMLSSVSWKRQKATEIIDYGLLWENGEPESGSKWVNLLGWYSTISVSTGHGESSISYGKTYTEQIQKHILKQTEIATCCEYWKTDQRGRQTLKSMLCEHEVETPILLGPVPRWLHQLPSLPVHSKGIWTKMLFSHLFSVDSCSLLPLSL